MSAHPLAGRLSALETATLHEAGAKAVLSSEIRMLSGDRCVVGRALTVMCHPGDNLMIHVAVARAEPGDMLVVQTHDAGYGVWGEVLTVAAMARGIVALVADGSVRDLASIRRHEFPVFARGVALRGASKAHEGTVNAPISCGGQPVWPGDLVAADESGIVVMAPGEVESILIKGEERGRKEAVMMSELRSGRTTLELLGLESYLTRDPSTPNQSGQA
jgi:4-hydroxy-4-methyl-2-oxoglutarate aldolase